MDHEDSKDYSGQVVAVWICVKWMVSLFSNSVSQLCPFLLGSICSRLGKVSRRNEMRFSHQLKDAVFLGQIHTALRVEE